MNLTNDAQAIIDGSANKVELEALIAKTDEWMKEKGIQATDLQWTILINHLNEMVKRSKSGETIPEVDPEMFNEVSEDALNIAGAVVQYLGNLAVDEKYVLSIHFESAKQNEA